MSIWFAPVSLDALNAESGGTMMEHLDLRFIAIGDDWLAATLPVDRRTRQPFGILHGGASVVLAETVGSLAGNLCVDRAKVRCVGQEINANHLRPVSDGQVTGTARVAHLGSRSQVWHIDITDPAGRPVCVSRLTLAIVPVPGG